MSNTINIETLFKEWLESGEEIKYNKIFNYFKPRLRSYLLSRQTMMDKNNTYNLSNDELEDVIADTLTKVYLKKDMYNKTFKVTTWVFTIAKNTLYDHIGIKKTKRYIYKSNIVNDNDDHDYFEEYLMNNVKNTEYGTLFVNGYEEKMNHIEFVGMQEQLFDSIK